MKIRQAETKKARIEIIPMIDAIFFLLVFFMFSSLSMVKLSGSNVDLPTSKAGEGTKTAAASNRLVVSLTARDDLYLDKTKVSRDTLAAELQKRVNGQPDAVLIVNLSKSQTTQSLIDVMDAVGKVKTPKGGAPAVLIATEPVDSAGNVLPGGADVTAPR
jgi:biopolymer transport protein ExbD